MDLEFQIDEGQRSYIEKIEIRGNINTKDKVIRRELAVSPGEVFDMVRVKVSKSAPRRSPIFRGRARWTRARNQPTRRLRVARTLWLALRRKTPAMFSWAAAFSSVDQIVGFAELNQGNFDIFNPPTFQGWRPEIPVARRSGFGAAGLCCYFH